MNKTAHATAKGIRMSPRKVGVVASLVRGRTVTDALTILDHTPRRASLPMKKVIESVRANADYNHKMKTETLTIREISVTPGPRLKRHRPAARGRALPYQKRTSHIRVVVDGEVRTPKPAASKDKTANQKRAKK